jgi:hypothetical protein
VHYSDIREGEYAVLSVLADGSGISAKDLEVSDEVKMVRKFGAGK